MEAIRVPAGNKHQHPENPDTTDFSLKRKKTSSVKSVTPEQSVASSSGGVSAVTLFSDRSFIKFRSVNSIGKGASARIFEAKQNKTDTHAIALKMGDLKSDLNGIDIVWVESEIKNNHCPCKNRALHDEALIQQKLKHENIVQFINFGHVNIKRAGEATLKVPVILMELAGVSLGTKLNTFLNYKQPRFNYDKQPFPLVQRFDILIDVAKGLKYIHDHSIVHSDLYPKNILISQNQAKICDFSESFQYPAKNIDTFEWSTGMTYMSPELFFAPEKASLKTDIFSMGVTIRMCIAGTARYNSWWVDKTLLRRPGNYSFTDNLPEPNKEAEIFNTFDAVTAEEMIDYNDEEYHRSLHKRTVAIDVLKNIAKPCMQVTPDQRPDVEQVLSLLEQKRRELIIAPVDSKSLVRPTLHAN